MRDYTLDLPNQPLWEVVMHGSRPGSGPSPNKITEYVRCAIPAGARQEAEKRRPGYYSLTVKKVG